MAPPKRPWFRLYVEAVTDGKLRRLTPPHRWLWVAVLAAARKSPVPGVLMLTEALPLDVDDLADFAGMKPKDVRDGLARMESFGLVEKSGKAWSVPSWAERQFESDTSADRMTKKRRSDGLSVSNVTSLRPRSDSYTPGDVTPPESETDNRTSSVSTDTQDGPVDNVAEDDPRITEATKLIIDGRRHDGIRNPQAWRQKVEAELRADGVVDELERLAGRFPLAPAAALAGHVLGEPSSLGAWR